MPITKMLLSNGWIAAVVCFMGYCLIGVLQDARELRTWKAEAARLEKIVGHLEVRDPGKIHVLQVSDDGPSEILWQVALPANQTWMFQYNMPIGGGGTSRWGPHPDNQQMIVRSRIIKIGDRWTLFVARSQGSGSNGLVDRVGEFLNQHWDELKVDAAGKGRQASYGVDEVISLLNVRVPASLFSTVRKKLGSYSVRKLKEEPILQIEIGTSIAFESRKKAAQLKEGD